MGLREYGKQIAGTLRDIPGSPMQVLPDEWFQDEWPLPDRPALGLESKRLQQEHAKSIASYLNRSLTANIGQIGRNVASIGRGDSGIRNQMIQQAMSQSNWTGGNIAGQGSLDIARMLMTGQLTREQMDEERMWRQAQLNAGGQQDWAPGGEMIMNMILMSQGAPPVAGGFGQAPATPYAQQFGYNQPRRNQPYGQQFGY